MKGTWRVVKEEWRSGGVWCEGKKKILHVGKCVFYLFFNNFPEQWKCFTGGIILVFMGK